MAALPVSPEVAGEGITTMIVAREVILEKIESRIDSKAMRGRMERGTQWRNNSFGTHEGVAQRPNLIIWLILYKNTIAPLRGQN